MDSTEQPQTNGIAGRGGDGLRAVPLRDIAGGNPGKAAGRRG